MHTHDPLTLNPAEIVHALRTHVRWWVTPAIACAVIAALYSLVAPREWRAVQTFTLRPEAASVSEQRLGKFDDLSELKVRQATILELAKSQSVVEATLTTVGPPPSLFSRNSHWPTAQDIEDFREQIDLRPPNGAEFGQSEVFYLSVRDKSRTRAAALVAALSDQLEQRMQSVRDDRAQSMMAELNRTVAMAEADLNVQIEKLANFEAAVGPDLAELRNLNAETGSQSEVALESQAIAGERRANEAKRRENQQLLALLRAAQDDPRQLIATPQTLLASQPAISRLKNALVDAQVRTANLLGYLAEDHPFVVAARESEQRIRSQLREELAVAIKGLEMDLAFTAEREKSLAQKLESGRERLARLAGARAEYANLVASVANHTKLVEAARKNLADARADHASAHTASIITRIDGVDTGVRPVGPGRLTVTAAGGVAGLMLGLGVVFLFGDGSQLTQTARSTQRAAAANQSVSATGEPFGMYHGMTLEEAIRSVESRPNGHGVN